MFTRLLCGVFFVALSVTEVSADDLPTEKITLVFDHALPNASGKSMKVVLVEYPPGGSSPAHTQGPTLLAAAAVPHLEQSRGAIINILSSLGTKAVAGLVDYAASKAALEHLTRCWAVELAPKGMRVNAIASGPVQSTFLPERMGYSDAEVEAIKTQERRVIPLGRRGVSEDVARWIVTLASRDADWVTGQVWGIDGGFALV